jgi:hypothetical protein
MLRKRAWDAAAMTPLVRFIVRFAAIAAAVPWQRFTLELNPVKWEGDAVIAVDGLLLIEQT